jgi:hypothetical protein
VIAGAEKLSAVVEEAREFRPVLKRPSCCGWQGGLGRGAGKGSIGQRVEDVLVALQFTFDEFDLEGAQISQTPVEGADVIEDAAFDGVGFHSGVEAVLIWLV